MAKYARQASSVANWLWNSRSVFGNDGRGTPLHYLLGSLSQPDKQKLARLIYRMLKFGAEYVDKGIEAYESIPATADELAYQTSRRTQAPTCSIIGNYRVSFWRLVVSKMGASPS